MPDARPLLTALALVATAGASAAEPLVLTLDPATTAVEFELDSTLHHVQGTLAVRDGRIRFDPATGEASGRVTLSAASADTDNKRRDRKMHAKVLESARFPEIALEPSRFEGSLDGDGPHAVTLTGDVLLHGGRHAVILEATITREGDRLTGTSSLDVPFVDWGLKDPSNFLLRVEKVVNVTLAIDGTLTEPGDR